MQAAEAEHEWVLCLDDDVMVHPDTLQQLVQGIKYQDAFMATGLPCRQVLCDPLLQGCCVHAQHAHSCGFACLLHPYRRPSMHALHMHAGSWVSEASTAPAQVKPSNSGKHRCSKDLHSSCSLLSASCLGVCCHALAWRKLLQSQAGTTAAGRFCCCAGCLHESACGSHLLHCICKVHSGLPLHTRPHTAGDTQERQVMPCPCRQKGWADPPS